MDIILRSMCSMHINGTVNVALAHIARFVHGRLRLAPPVSFGSFERAFVYLELARDGHWVTHTAFQSTHVCLSRSLSGALVPHSSRLGSLVA